MATNNKILNFEEVLAKNATVLKRARAVRASSIGGRYSVKTRRLTLPADFAGRLVKMGVADGVLVLGVVAKKGEGASACHAKQHFVTLPVGTVVAEKNLTLEKVDLPEVYKNVDTPMVAYKLPA